MNGDVNGDTEMQGRIHLKGGMGFARELQLSIAVAAYRGCRDGPAVKSTGCSSGEVGNQMVAPNCL